MNVSNERDVAWMRLALELARQGEGLVEPNPMVGCVLVRDGEEIGRGWHQKFGGPHAEREAIADANRRGNSDLSGATAYVSLEPCCHTGKTSPCTDAVIAAGIRRVVMAMRDPFEEVAGRGERLLSESGVQVVCGVLEEQARALNAPYIQRLTQQRPWLIAKWAMSLDGKIATRTGDSQWISNEHSRRWVHEIRTRVDAVIVGSGTLTADDPQLQPRDVEMVRRPLRVVVDSELLCSPTSRIMHDCSEFPVLLWAGPQVMHDPAKLERAEQLRKAGAEVVISEIADRNARLQALLRYLAVERKATRVLVEGGGKLLGSLAQLDLINQCEVFLGPLVIGGSDALTPVEGTGIERLLDAQRFSLQGMESLGDDVHLTFLQSPSE